jgi:hypothetical protein
MAGTRRILGTRIAVASFFIAVSLPVFGHGTAHAPGDFHFWSEWSARPGVVIPFAIGTTIYAAGLLRCWARAGIGRGISRVRAASFGAGLLTLVAALMSPLDSLSSTRPASTRCPMRCSA